MPIPISAIPNDAPRFGADKKKGPDVELKRPWYSWHEKDLFKPKVDNPGMISNIMRMSGPAGFLLALYSKAILLPTVATLGVLGLGYSAFLRKVRFKIEKVDGQDTQVFFLNNKKMLSDMQHLSKKSDIKFDKDKQKFVKTLADKTTQELDVVSPRPILRDVIKVARLATKPIRMMEERKMLDKETSRIYQKNISRGIKTVLSLPFNDAWVSEFFRVRKGFLGFIGYGFKMLKQVWHVFIPSRYIGWLKFIRR